MTTDFNALVEGELERYSRQWEKTEDRLHEQISRLQDQVRELQLQVQPQGSIVIPPGRGKATREGLHKALDCIVAAWIATWPSGELRSLQTTSIMELMMWAGEWRKETGAE